MFQWLIVENAVIIATREIEKVRNSTMCEVEEVEKLKLGGCVWRRAKASSQKEARESPGDGVWQQVALKCREHELNRCIICKLHHPFHGSRKGTFDAEARMVAPLFYTSRMVSYLLPLITWPFICPVLFFLYYYYYYLCPIFMIIKNKNN